MLFIEIDGWLTFYVLFLFARLLIMVDNSLGLSTRITMGSRMIWREARLNFIAIRAVTLQVQEQYLKVGFNMLDYLSKPSNRSTNRLGRIVTV